jgi:hypothetical protein
MLRNQQQFREGQPYISYNADLLPTLDGQEGVFEVIHGNQSFVAKCEDVPNHSPVLTSLIPTGTKNVWIITKQEPLAAGQTESERSRAAGAGR